MLFDVVRKTKIMYVCFNMFLGSGDGRKTIRQTQMQTQAERHVQLDAQMAKIMRKLHINIPPNGN